MGIWADRGEPLECVRESVYVIDGRRTPPGREKMDETLGWLARNVLDEQLIDMAWHFDDVSNVSQFTALLEG